MTIDQAIDKVIAIAQQEIGYLEKRNANNLDDKTANAGDANYTKYWRDIAPEYQGLPWCAAFVTWCFTMAFGKENTKKMLKHYPYISCPEISKKFTLYANPLRGDIVDFWRSGEFAHTGLVSFTANAGGDPFSTVEGNTSGGSTIIANGGGVYAKTYYNSNLPGTKFIRPDYSIVADEPSCTDFPKYDLSDSAIRDIATCITGEQGGEDVTACRQEASQIANLNEVTYGRANTEANILKTLHGGWYAKSSWDNGCTQTAIDAVKFVLVEGKRVLPRYVTEHDMFPLDAAISGHWGNGKSENRSQYVPHQTTIKQNPSRFSGGGSSYTFYTFFGSNGNKDVAGYYAKDYEKYKNDIPWGESREGGLTSKEYEELVKKNDLQDAAINAAGKDIQDIVKAYPTMIYDYIDENMPAWYRPTIEKLVRKGYLKGDEQGRLRLTETEMRLYTVNDRAGIYGE